MEGNLYVKGKDKKLRIRNCKDNVSRGRSNRRGGLKGQTRAAKIANVRSGHSVLRPGNEEHWSSDLRMEIKSGAQVGPAITAFEKAESQSEAQKAYGDVRPFVAGFVPKEQNGGVIFAFRARTTQEIVNTIEAWRKQLGVDDS